MKGKAFIPLVLGLGIGLLAVKFLVDTLKKAQASGAATKIAAVRAKEDIEAFAEIKAEMVETFQTTDPQFAPTEERIGKIEEVVGRVAGKGIPQHAPVLKSMLAPEGTPAGMVGRIPPGFRAVSVKIDEVTGVAYQLKPGDWVDVIVVMDVETSGGAGSRGKKETIAEVILQRVQVAAIGYGPATTPGEGGSKVKPAKSATLLVLESDAPKLHLAATRGKVTLAMRGDDEHISPNPLIAIGSQVVAALRDGQAGAPPEKDSTTPAPSIPPPVLPIRGVPADEDVPHAVMVVHGTVGLQKAAAIERITFAHANSPNILEVASGPPTRAASRMTGTAMSRRPPAENTAPTGKASAKKRTGTAETEPAADEEAEDEEESPEGGE